MSTCATTIDTLTLAANVLNFDIMEVWTEVDGRMSRIFTHAMENLVFQYPDITQGYYPRIHLDKILSSEHYNYYRKSEYDIIWRGGDGDSAFSHTFGYTSVFKEFPISLKTEVIYQLPPLSGYSPNLIIVGLAQSQLSQTPAALRYLRSISEVIRITVMEIDNLIPLCEANEGPEDNCRFRDPPSASASTNYIETSANQSNARYTQRRDQISPISVTGGRQDYVSKDFNTNPLYADSHSTFINRRPNNTFIYPILQIPVLSLASDNMSIDEFRDMKYVTHGSNSNVFIGLWGYHEKVVVKMMKEEVANDPVAILEFDLERAMLSRLDHPNIVSYIGSGRHPRRFIVLEWLSGDTLHAILYRNQKSKPGVLMPYSKEPTFNMTSLLSKAKELASAIDYLHHRVHPGATIIHRDLKPDNIAFAKDGSVKLIDFGLSACVRSRTTSEESYAMTGCTGSLRYMAPEVTLRRSYTEKVDVYSFGVLLWQMAKDKVPFQDIKKGDLEERVAIGGERPKLDRSWSIGFCQLLEACWHANPERRPAFSEILRILDDLLTENGSSSSSAFKSWSEIFYNPGAVNPVTRTSSTSTTTTSLSNITSSSSSSSTVTRFRSESQREAIWF